MSKTNSDIAIQVASELVDDLELSRLSLLNCFMKACRLARLLGDLDSLQIFQWEIAGYPTTPDGVPPEVWRLLVVAKRVIKTKNAKDDSVDERAFTGSVDQIQAQIDAAKQRLEFCRPQNVSISSANPNQYVHAPFRDLTTEANIAASIADLSQKLAARKAFLYGYALDKYYEMRISGGATSVFERYRNVVDENIGAIIPDDIKRLDSIYENIDSGNSEDWANACHSCRRLLQALADKLNPSVSEEYKLRSGKTIKTGKENYINRLVLFCEEKIESGVAVDILGSSLRFVGERLDSIFDAAQKGSHRDVTRKEAERCIIQTYIIIGDIVGAAVAGKSNEAAEFSAPAGDLENLSPPSEPTP